MVDLLTLFISFFFRFSSPLQFGALFLVSGVDDKSSMHDNQTAAEIVL